MEGLGLNWFHQFIIGLRQKRERKKKRVDTVGRMTWEEIKIPLDFLPLHTYRVPRQFVTIIARNVVCDLLAGRTEIEFRDLWNGRCGHLFKTFLFSPCELQKQKTFPPFSCVYEPLDLSSTGGRHANPPSLSLPLRPEWIATDGRAWPFVFDPEIE